MTIGNKLFILIYNTMGWKIPKNIVGMTIGSICLLLLVLFASVYSDDLSSEQSLMYRLHEQQAELRTKAQQSYEKAEREYTQAEMHYASGDAYRKMGDEYIQESHLVFEEIEKLTKGIDIGNNTGSFKMHLPQVLKLGAKTSD